MAVKVIQPGTLLNAPLWGRCACCNGTLECVRGDTEHREARPGDGADAVRCPTPGCGRWVYLRSGNAPKPPVDQRMPAATQPEATPAATAQAPAA